MALSFYPLKISIADKTSGDPITVATYSQLNLRRYDYSVAAYPMIGSSGGTFEFGDSGNPIVAGDYKLYNNTTELTAFGIIRIGEPNAVMLTTNQTIAGVKTFSNQIILSAGAQTDTISEKTAGSGVTIDNILLKDDLATSNIPSLGTNNNTFTNTNTFESGKLVLGAYTIFIGAGDPNSSITGSVGDIYINVDGADYYKDTGTATDTGWVAK